MGNFLSSPNATPMPRRGFLAGMAVLGSGAALVGAAAAPELLTSKDQNANAPGSTTKESAGSTTAPSPNDVGKVTNIKSEMKEFKDPKTGARILQLTSDGSNNVHPYFRVS